MCYKCQEPEMAGLHPGHLPLLVEAAPRLEDITRGLYSALTESLNPHLPVLPAFVALVEALRNEDFGVLSEYRLVRLPLSIIGTDKVRYRTKVVEWLHESILSMRMSEIAVGAIQAALRPIGLCIFFQCSCGVVMGRCEDVQRYYGSVDHKNMDRLRSAIDASGNPVHLIDSFEDIPVLTMDLHRDGAEARLFARIEELIRLASTAGHRDYGWIDAELQLRVLRAQPQTLLVGV